MSRSPWLLGLLSTALLAGCGPSGPRTYPVSGTVLFDGKPLPQGDIIFHAARGDMGADAGKIKDGKYSFRAKAGKKKVAILASKEVPGKRDPLMGPLIENYVPARYNDETTLTAEVRESGENQFDFQLQRK
jgi:hypothetical protein